MIVRRATKKDFKGISNLIKTEYFKHYNEKWTDERVFGTLKYYKKVGKIFVADENKIILGFVIIRTEFGGIIIEELIVSGNYQGKGIGKKLMNFVEHYSKKNEIDFIWLMTYKKARAFGFYKKIGYKYDKNVTYFSKRIR